MNMNGSVRGARMGKYCFYVKKEIDLKKYGFQEDDYFKRYVIWNRGVWRIKIDWKDMSLHFNQLSGEFIKIFIDMIKDDIVIVKEEKRILRPHQIYLTDEEYEYILKRRKEEEDG